MPRLDDATARSHATRLESLLAALEALPDPVARETATGAIEVLLGLYGEGLARILERLERAGEAAVARALAEDELVGHLLLLHGLHPEDPATRVTRALAGARAALVARGGDVTLLDVRDGVVRIRVVSADQHRCGSSAAALHRQVEDAVRRAAPDVERVEVESAEPPAPLLQIGLGRALARDGTHVG